MPGADPVVTVHPFTDLDATTAYAIWRLRQEVFVVEQECVYLDLDGRDPEPTTRHVVLRDGDVLAGYLRILHDAEAARIGRVVLAAAYRGRGLADLLMHAALAEIGDRACVLAAQTPLAGWYAGFGFVTDGPDFLDDGIPHRPMRRRALAT